MDSFETIIRDIYPRVLIGAKINKKQKYYLLFIHLSTRISNIKSKEK
jgi:hypothetical protein